MPEPVRLFVSYKSEDSHEVRAVVDLLRMLGIDVWFAEYHVLSSTYDAFTGKLDESLQAAVAQATHALIFSNLRWSESPHCRNELDWIRERFRGQNERVLHVRIPREPLPPLTATQTEELGAFAELVYPQDQNGHQTVAREVLRRFAPHTQVTVAPNQLKGRRVYFSENGSWGSLCLFGVEEPESLQSLLEQKDASIRRWTGDLSNVPVEIELSLTPLQSILSPWELVDRSEGKSAAERDFIDDRRVYGRLRTAAQSWLKSNRLEEQGLHLFWHRQFPAETSAEAKPNGKPPNALAARMGKMAITCLKRGQAGRPNEWTRRYLLVVIDPWSGAIGQVSLAVSMPWQSTDEAEELRRFLGVAPTADRIAESVTYFGAPQKSWGEVLFTALVSVGIAVGMMHVFLHSWSLWMKLGFGTALGLLTTPRLLSQSRPSAASLPVLPSRQTEFHSEKYGYTLAVPPGWNVSRGLLAYISNRWGDVDVRLTPIGRNFPQLAINVAADPKWKGRSDSQMTRQFGERNKRMILSQSLGARIKSYQLTTIDEIEAFEVIYAIPTPGMSDTGFFKMGFFFEGRQFYVQGSCEELDRDVEVMRRIMRSIKIKRGM